MGDGGIALILDVHGLGLRSGILKPVRQALGSASGASVAAGAGSDPSTSMLLFRAGGFPRVALPLAKVARLEQIPRADVELAAGRNVVQYRNDILPLVSVAEMLGSGNGHDADVLEVVVCRHGAATLGLVVDEVMDAVQETVGSVHGESRPGLLGSAVLGGQVTDILDLDAVVAWGTPAVSADSLARLRDAIGVAPVGAETWEARP